MSWVLLLTIMLAIVIYFVTVTVLWATWNYVIPRLTNSIKGSPQPFTNISWPTASVFAFLILFLAYPVGNWNMFGQLVSWSMRMLAGEK